MLVAQQLPFTLRSSPCPRSAAASLCAARCKLPGCGRGTSCWWPLLILPRDPAAIAAGQLALSPSVCRHRADWWCLQPKDQGGPGDGWGRQYTTDALSPQAALLRLSPTTWPPWKLHLEN